MRQGDLRRDRKGTGYIESIFAIMIISISLTLLLASWSVIRLEDSRGDLEQEARGFERQIMGVLSEDGITIEKRNFEKLATMEWELGEMDGMRAEIQVIGDGDTRLRLIAMGEVPDAVDECCSISEPICYIEEWPQAQAAKLVVLVW